MPFSGLSYWLLFDVTLGIWKVNVCVSAPLVFVEMKNVLLLLQNCTLQMHFGNILQEFCEPSCLFPGPLSLLVKIILLPLQDLRLDPAKAKAYLFLQNASWMFPASPENKIPWQLHHVPNLTPAHSQPKRPTVLLCACSIPFLPGQPLTCLPPKTHPGLLTCRGSSPSGQPQSLQCHGKSTAWIPGQFSPMCKPFCFGEIPGTQAVSMLPASRLPHAGCEGCQQQEFTAAGCHAAYCLWTRCNLSNWGHKNFILWAEVVLCFWSHIDFALASSGVWVSYSPFSANSKFWPSSSQSQNLPCSLAWRTRLEGRRGAGREGMETRLTSFATEGVQQEQCQPECFWKLPAAHPPSRNPLCFQEGEGVLVAALLQAGGSWKPCSLERLQCRQAGAEEPGPLPVTCLPVFPRLNHGIEQH